MDNQIINLIKAHKSQIIQYGKKLFQYLKNRKNKTQGGNSGGGGGGGYAGAAGGGYNNQQQQQGGYQQSGQQHQGYQQQGYQQQGYQQGGGNYGQQGQGQYQPQQQQYYGGQQNQGNYDHPPPQGQYGRPTTTSPAQMPSGVKPNHGRYNDNEVNQKNEHYKQLRAQAHSEGDRMAKCFDGSHKAYSSGDSGRAKQLSNEGHEHKRKMEQANQEAADWIYVANNEDSGPNEVDLHGLYTEEAIRKTEQAIQEHQRKGTPEIRVIVGKGIHSQNHVAHIKPAIEKMMQDYNIAANIDPKNAGVLIVHLQGGGGGGGAPQGAYRDAGFTRDLAKNASGDEENCTIM
ncbi:hypothetical protein CBS101457_001773 [Exobasidium rhododendri]|nr:hypothetical protein CBS101457_001773 [Exobasidium rhododendri]